MQCGLLLLENMSTVKFNLHQAMNAQMESKSVPLFFL